MKDSAPAASKAAEEPVEALLVCDNMLVREVVAESLEREGVVIPHCVAGLESIPERCDADLVVVVEASAGDVLPESDLLPHIVERFDRWLVIGPGGVGSTLHYLAERRGEVSAIPFEIRKEDIHHAVKLAARTQSLCIDNTCRKHPTRELTRLQAANLDAEQWHILRLLAAGAPNKQIANALNCEEHRVKAMLRRLLLAIDANNRTQAAVIAARAGL